MYKYVLNMWVMRKFSEARVRACCPEYISQVEVEKILATPQTP